MWRSVVAARASLCRHTASKLPEAHTLTLPSSETLTPISRFSAQVLPGRASPSATHHPRFFSTDRSDSDSGLSKSSEAISDPDLSETLGENGGGAQLDGFAKAGEISSAQSEGFVTTEEFDEDRYEKLLSLLRSGSEGSMESSLKALGLSLSEELVVRVLETPQLSTKNLIGLFRWVLKEKPEFVVTSLVVDSLVLSVCESGLSEKHTRSLWDLVKQIGEKKTGAVTVESLNHLVALFSKLGKGKAAVEVFDKFGDFGIEPIADTYYFVIEALCRRSTFDWAWSYCQKMIDVERVPDGEKVGKIISWFCKGKLAKDAHSVYALAKEKKQHPPRCAVEFLIYSLCRKDDTVRLALEMLDDFKDEERKYAIKPFLAVIRGLCRTKDLSEAKKLLLKMTADGPPPGNAAFNSVIHGYSKAGDMGEAFKIMKVMEKRGLKPDVYAYTVIISGYTSGGQMAEARKIFAEARTKHCKLSPVTYHTLIRGYCRLEAFDKALELLAEMKNHGVEVNADEYNKLIQSLCLKAVDWETAEKLQAEMKEKGLHLNGITRGLVRAVKEMVEEEVDAAKI